jgi:hypothetical protein
MIKPWQAGVAGTVVVVVGAAAVLWWQRQSPPITAQPPAQVEPAAPPVAQAPIPPQAPPAIQHPIEAAPAASAPLAPAQPLPPLAESNDYVKDALMGLLGKQAVLTLMQTDNFPSRVVVTVDNLAREHASPRLWPVNPVDGRFVTDERDGAPWLAPRNAARYNTLVKFVESVDTREAVALYVQMYPLFQQAYEELGYPGRYFNDRLVEVIDHLLATPDLTGPVELTMTEVKGPYATEKPWAGYQYADPKYEQRSAGQKLMLRVGSANAQRLKAELREFRALVTKAPLGANAAPR